MRQLDDCTVYLFVRGDLREEDQVVQSNHATFAMVSGMKVEYGLPRIVALDGGSSEKAFVKTLRKIQAAGIQHIYYCDPDKPELGITAIATAPLTKEQSFPL